MMAGVNENVAVSVWRERVETLVEAIRPRSRIGVQLAREIGGRLIDQEKDIEALMTLLAKERERNEALSAGIEGYPERPTEDGELQRLRDYALSVRLREVETQKALNGERQKVARLEARLMQVMSTSL